MMVSIPGENERMGFIFSFITLGFGALIAKPVMIGTLFLGMAPGLAGMVYSLYGSYRVYHKQDFLYLRVGSWVKRRGYLD